MTSLRRLAVGAWAVGLGVALLSSGLAGGSLDLRAPAPGFPTSHGSTGMGRPPSVDTTPGVDFAPRSPAAGSALRAPTPAWVDRSAVVSHLSTNFGMIAYDAALSEIVEFDGPFSSTWVYSGGLWTNATASIAPPPRAYGGLAYDAAVGEVVLFGGISPSGAALNDTWAFDGGIWKNVTAAHSPPARFAAGFAADPADGGDLLFGGSVPKGPNVTFANDTWIYRATTGWAPANSSVLPPALIGAGLAYDSARAEDVLFGGVGTTGPDVVSQHDWFSNQTWVFAGGNWTNATSGLTPSAREFPAMAGDVETGASLVLFGGQAPGNSTASYLNDTWTFDSGAWSRLPSTLSGPLGRVSAGLVWDSAAGSAILTGGLFGNTSTPDRVRVDSWSYRTGNWSTLSTGPAPSPRFGPGFATSQGAEGFPRLFGGYTGVNATVNDTWSFADEAWQYDAGASTPPAVAFPAMAPDPAAGAQVLFGGRTASGAVLNETWTDATGWVNRSIASSPPARFGATLVYDPTLAGDILFGGLTGTNLPLNDTWRYAGGTWTKLSPARSPPARVFGSATWDPVDAGLLLFGGSTSATSLGTADFNDTWLFAGGNWTELAPTASPAGRIGATLTFDERRDAPLLFGGWSTLGSGTMFNDTWFLSGGASSPWVQIPAHGAPAPGGFAQGWWDGPSNATWIYGGAAFSGGGLTVSPSAKTYALDLLSTTTSISGTGGPTPYTVNFSALSDHGAAPYGFSWQLQGMSSGGPAGSFTIDIAGSFTLYLNVTDAWGVFERFAFPISTTPGPLRATFIASPSNGTAPLNVLFHGSAVGGSPPYLYAWNFGDGSSPISGPSPNASHEFLRNLTFNVTLTVSGSSGPSASWSENVSLRSLAPFDVSARLTPGSGTVPLNVTFSATTRNGTSPFHFVWSFGDGGTSTRASGTHEFVAPGNFTVRLNATDTNGTLVQRTLAVEVSGPATGPVGGSRAASSALPWWVWALGGAAVVAVVGGIVWARRRGPPSEPERAPSESSLPWGRRPALPPPKPPKWSEDDE